MNIPSRISIFMRAFLFLSLAGILLSCSTLALKPGEGYLSGEPLEFSPKESSVTWIGHSTVLIHLDGKNILTDPNYLERLIFFERKQPPGVPFRRLPPIDAILISHGHLDHLDINTLKLFPREIPIVLPWDLDRVVKDYGFRDVRVLELWEKTRIGSLTITAVPVKHYTGRHPFHLYSKYQGYIIEGSKTVLFIGDSGLSETFQELGKKYQIDIALLPIGTYRPSFFRKYHMNPEDALVAFSWLKAREMVPIHYDTFGVGREPFGEAPRLLGRAARERGVRERVFILKPGERKIF